MLDEKTLLRIERTQSRDITTIIINLNKENALLRQALEEVEFVSYGEGDYCPWCLADDISEGQDHKPDCLRQRVLGINEE